MVDPGGPVTVDTLDAHDDVAVVLDLLHAVWGGEQAIVPRELLVALVHAGGYVAVATVDDRALGASVGVLGRAPGIGLAEGETNDMILHSHVTGVLPAARGCGVGWALKRHQLRWARERGLAAITWTFDPLVRRNAWFNIERLGVDVVAYRRAFYGEMVDEVNAGDESDRLVVRWDTAPPALAEREDSAAGGSRAEIPTRVPTPVDIVGLRRTDPAAVRIWRRRHRAELQTALDAGRRVLGFSSEGEYLIESAG